MTKIKIKEELWDIVEEALKNEKASAYKMAVIEADKTLDNLMTLKGVPGTSTKDRALKIKEHFSDIRKLMEAFDIKEKILEHLSYNLTSVEVNDALASYQKAIVDIESGGKSIPLKERIKLYLEYYIPKKLKKLRNIAFGIMAFLGLVLFTEDTWIGGEIVKFILGIARFFYYKVIVVLIAAAVVLGLVFVSFIFMEHKNKG
ncbi:TPA: hypothetical protein DDW69_00330 [candidate division CPR2 bacterium]|uniref:Uncharacterized protein n=1 Tax=candidate division CPR2 bacterium GW2011_GWC1_41_48 TaxID=1618344 RepID=A0A0G0Z6P5_UNCC2|nr:MAG: hypothetical protein UT47_C0005G0004 [candidate division CPR2 bacterium GW2011_GWC2_39_35]KKR28171.1 MAG: hypothetical protein UT60_C0026G0002 [candidate division CPR2 bacterium GW2011_GWD2_39_7]KKS08693.1 MAG: hypothetical protein UU65_C0005G0004 [candidate division CPR2 bacterium GW2011_GWC1_41_48]OGB72282.1 MAG: hypothetical protein A2Y26_03455 [candidate division CPR2 bacterium GWD2_39_7]HBG81270.1 hypothetical protein [candidate division CPR2 bacterium]